MAAAERKPGIDLTEHEAFSTLKQSIGEEERSKEKPASRIDLLKLALAYLAADGRRSLTEPVAISPTEKAVDLVFSGWQRGKQGTEEQLAEIGSLSAEELRQRNATRWEQQVGYSGKLLELGTELLSEHLTAPDKGRMGKLLGKGDLGTSIALLILDEAGFDTSRTLFIEKAEHQEGLPNRLNVDIGRQEGFVTEAPLDPALRMLESHIDDGKGKGGQTVPGKQAVVSSYRKAKSGVAIALQQAQQGLRLPVGQRPKGAGQIQMLHQAEERINEAARRSDEFTDRQLSQVNLTSFLDNHVSQLGRSTSAAKFAYDMAVETGLLKRRSDLEVLVEFMNGIDNFSFPEMGKHFSDSHRSLVGLRRSLDPRKLLEWIQWKQLKGDSINFLEPLTDDDLERLDLAKPRPGERTSRVEQRKELIEENKKIIKTLGKEGYATLVDAAGKDQPIMTSCFDPTPEALRQEVGGRKLMAIVNLDAKPGQTDMQWAANEAGFPVYIELYRTPSGGIAKYSVKLAQGSLVDLAGKPRYFLGPNQEVVLGDSMLIMRDDVDPPKLQLAAFVRQLMQWLAETEGNPPKLKGWEEEKEEYGSQGKPSRWQSGGGKGQRGTPHGKPGGQAKAKTSGWSGKRPETGFSA